MKKQYAFIVFASLILLSASFAWGQAQHEGHGQVGRGDEPSHTEEAGGHHSIAGEIDWILIVGFVGTIVSVGYLGARSDKWKDTNLLDVQAIKNLLKSRWYPLVFVLPTTVVFGVIFWQLFFGSLEASSNFGSVMVWILMWPVLPVLFLLFGRFWCSICPMSRVSDEAQKRVGLQRKVPRFLQKHGVWIIIFAFLFATWSDVTVGLVESPRNTGFFLLFILGGVVTMGAVFERRAWCRYLCFLGGLSSNYSMSSSLQLRADGEVCKTCTAPTCYKGDGKVAGCSMFEYPRMMDSNRFCNFCSNCVKTCRKDAIKINMRIHTSELWFIKKPRVEDSFLASVLIGLVVVQTIIMLEVWEPFMAWFESSTGISNFTVAWTIIFIGANTAPLLLMLAASYISTILAGTERGQNIDADNNSHTGNSAETSSTKKAVIANFAKYGYALIPLGLAIHLAHNLKHFLGEGLSIVYSTALLTGTNITGELAIVNMPTIQIIQYILSILGTVGAAYTVTKISSNNSDSKISVLPYIILIAVFGVISLWLYSVPMDPRAH